MRMREKGNPNRNTSDVSHLTSASTSIISSSL